jgi:Xaa-Pro aminopeptidase
MKIKDFFSSLLTCCVLSLLIISPYSSALSEHPWEKIRKERINTLLPKAMKAANVDAWLVICRENANDPLAKHVGCENAGQTAAFIFYQSDNKFASLAFSPKGEAMALADLGLLDEVTEVERGANIYQLAADFVKAKDLKRVAINSSDANKLADGLSHSQYKKLAKALGTKYIDRLVSSEKLVYEYLAIKLPSEVEIMRQAAATTAKWQLEAYAQVVPGKTTDRDVALFLKNKMKEAGVGDAWSPDQNPNVVSGTDRGHSHATDRVIQPGDVIQTDFGIRVHDTWVTDIQRFAYVLKEGETKPPKDIAYYWESAKKGREAAFNAMKPGATGRDVDTAQRDVLTATNSIPVMWSTGHPVGYVAHDAGPNLGGAYLEPPRPASLLPLKEGMTFAFDGFHSWLLPNGKPKTISVEEMVVITKDGAEYLIPPQQDLVLISQSD